MVYAYRRVGRGEGVRREKDNCCHRFFVSLSLIVLDGPQKKKLMMVIIVPVTQ